MSKCKYDHFKQVSMGSNTRLGAIRKIDNEIREMDEIKKVLVEYQKIRDEYGISMEQAFLIISVIEQRKTNKLLDWIYDTITTN